MWEILDTQYPARRGPRYASLERAARVVELAQPVPTCSHCGRPIADDDGIWYHPETMSARCDGPDDEPGIGWGDLVRQADPVERYIVRWIDERKEDEPTS